LRTASGYSLSICCPAPAVNGLEKGEISEIPRHYTYGWKARVPPAPFPAEAASSHRMHHPRGRVVLKRRKATLIQKKRLFESFFTVPPTLGFRSNRTQSVPGSRVGLRSKTFRSLAKKKSLLEQSNGGSIPR